jgi:hypothetical protein
MFQAHALDSFPDPCRLFPVNCFRFAVADGAECAIPCADAAQDHEGSSAARVTAAPVGTPGAIANRIKVMACQAVTDEIVYRKVVLFLGPADFMY